MKKHNSNKSSLSEEEADAIHYIDQARQKLTKEDYAGVLSAISKSIKIRRDYSLAYHLRAIAYVKLREYEKAIEDLNICLYINSDQPGILVLRAICYGHLNQKDKLLKDMLTIEYLNPECLIPCHTTA